MLWMGIWVHPYTVIHVQVARGQFLKNFGMAKPEWRWVVMVEAENGHRDCISHPCWMYTNVIPVRGVGAKFWKIGVWANPNDMGCHG